MRCRRCNTLLLEEARFCTNCGLPTAGTQHDSVSSDAATPPTSSPPEEHDEQTPVDSGEQADSPEATLIVKRSQHAPTIEQPVDNKEATGQEKNTPKTYDEELALEVPSSLPQAASTTIQEKRPAVPRTPPAVIGVSPKTPSPSLSIFRLNTSEKATHMLPAVVQPQMPRRKRRGGAGCLLTLLLVLAILIGAWFFIVRPYLHTMAENQIDRELSTATNQLPQISQLPVNSIPISENLINNLIVINTAPSSPVQNTRVSISPQNFKLTFQVYGMENTVTQVPKVENGQLVATNVTVTGPLLLIMTPDEMTSILNRNFAAMQQRIQRPITDVQLKDHEMDLILQ